jgi:hypothetical protein
VNNTGPILTPDLRAQLDRERQTIFANFNCHQVGQIVGFTATGQSPTAEVSLVLSRAVWNQVPAGDGPVPTDPNIYEYPLLVSVPVFVLSGGSAVVTMPIAVGDFCLVLFNDRNLDPWWSKGSLNQPPESYRMHSLADGIALVGLRPMAAVIAGYSSTLLGIRRLDAGKINISNANQNLITILTALVGHLIAGVDTGGYAFNAGTAALLAADLANLEALLA